MAGYSLQFKLLMLLDSIALALIAGCTAYEGYEDWENPLHIYYPFNIITIFFWIIGLTLAVVGLFLVIANAANFENIPIVEHIGMAMLTFAPVVNTLAWLCLRKRDPAYIEMEQYLSTEFIEFLGMFLVSCSYWNKDIASTYFELCGYTVLSCAALWDVTYPKPQSTLLPFSIHIVIRSGYVHWYEALGLFLLGVVAIGKYLIHDEIHHSSSNDHKKYDSHLLPTSSLSIMSSDDHLGIGLGIPIGSTGFGGVSTVNTNSSTGISSGRKGD